MTLGRTKPSRELARLEAKIAARAMAYPEVTRDEPWGHQAFKIRGKTFLFLGADADSVSLSVKLPESGSFALSLPNTAPTHYGLGKSGWVSATLRTEHDVPFDLVEEWLNESFRAIAPKKVVAGLAEKPPSQKPAAKKPAAKKPAAKKPAAEKPAAEKPAAEKPAAEKPAAEKPRSRRRG